MLNHQIRKIISSPSEKKTSVKISVRQSVLLFPSPPGNFRVLDRSSKSLSPAVVQEPLAHQHRNDHWTLRVMMSDGWQGSFLMIASKVPINTYINKRKNKEQMQKVKRTSQTRWMKIYIHDLKGKSMKVILQKSYLHHLASIGYSLVRRE